MLCNCLHLFVGTDGLLFRFPVSAWNSRSCRSVYSSGLPRAGGTVPACGVAVPRPRVYHGHLNCNMLDSTNPGKARLSEMFQSYHLHQFVRQPDYSSGSLLDAVISNSNDAVPRVGVFDCALSPHSYVRSLLMFTKCRSKPSRVRTRILKYIDHSSLLRDLYFVDRTGVFPSDSVADMWSHLLAPVIDKQAPVKCISIRNPTAPPVTSATLDLMAQRRGVLRREGKSSAFRDLNRRVRSAIRRDCPGRYSGEPVRSREQLPVPQYPPDSSR